MKDLISSVALLLSLAACSESVDPADSNEHSRLRINVCRTDCSLFESDSVLSLTYENGVKINVDTLGPGECRSLQLTTIFGREFSTSDTLHFGYVKEAREFWGPPRTLVRTPVSLPLTRDSVSIGCR